jgi:hypothetical protein
LTAEYAEIAEKCLFYFHLGVLGDLGGEPV